MRNGFLGALAFLVFLAGPARAQAPPSAEPPSFVPGLDAPWRPPATDLDERPKVGPPGYPFYGQVDYLLWWNEKDRRVAVSPATTDFGPLLRNGARALWGYWLDEQQSWGLEVGGFVVLNRAPTDGDATVHTQLDNRLWGAEAQLRGEMYRNNWGHIDLLGGFRYLNLDEALHLGERTAGAVTADYFGVHNRYYGGQLGAEVECHRGKWSADVWGKVALGATCEEVRLNGTAWTAGRLLPGGLLVPAAASGQQRRDAFAVLPEVGFNAAYQLTNNIRLTVGYTFFYVSDAARPGGQAESLLKLPHPPQGPLPVRGGEFWGQGLNLGLEFRF